MSGSYYLQWAQRKRMERNDVTKMRVCCCVGKLCAESAGKGAKVIRTLGRHPNFLRQWGKGLAV